MDVDLNEVRHMAKLSRLAITESEEKIFARQFGEILGHMAILKSVDTTGIEPLYIPVKQAEGVRQDIRDNRRSRDEILANAPGTDGEYFIVPRII